MEDPDSEKDCEFDILLSWADTVNASEDPYSNTPTWAEQHKTECDAKNDQNRVFRVTKTDKIDLGMLKLAMSK